MEAQSWGRHMSFMVQPAPRLGAASRFGCKGQHSARRLEKGQDGAIWRKDGLEVKKKRFEVCLAAHDEGTDAEEGDDVGGGGRGAQEYACRDVTRAIWIC